VTPELAVYAAQTRWLLQQLDQMLGELPAETLVAMPPAALEGNCLLAVAKHAAAVTEVYAFGFGAGMPVERDRSREFTATAADFPAIRTRIQHLLASIDIAFGQATVDHLDTPFVPPQHLYGTGDPRQMTPREAIVENIRHLGIHLGEARLTRSLLESQARA
jgi:hypothetical protein